MVIREDNMKGKSHPGFKAVRAGAILASKTRTARLAAPGRPENELKTDIDFLLPWLREKVKSPGLWLLLIVVISILLDGGKG